MYPPLSTKCTTTLCLVGIYTHTSAWVRPKLHQGRETISVLKTTTNRMEIHMLASFIFVKQKKVIGLVFRLHILSDTWLHYWPFVPCEIQEQHQCISKIILNLPDTENTEHMRFKASLYLLTVPHQQKQHNIECHEIEIISKISSTMSFRPQAIVRDAFFYDASQLFNHRQ